ncbi:MAG TPA: hypothetical protein VJ816_10350 [Gemmatimonadales bacterium]|nr:hypothetical protein [Gemmatimonadales bacterium]
MLLSWLLLQSSALTGTFKSPRVTESSGVVVSRGHAGTLWTHNDSGDGPYLYATDSSGNDYGAIRVSGAEATDWEDMASGPCPAGRAGATCLYIADTGDNLEQRKSVTIYAVPEPEPSRTAADTQRVTAAARALRLRYPDGSHDVEAIYVSPRDTAVYLVSKGRGGSVALYRVARRTWSSESVVTAERLQTLPIVPNRRLGRMVTGAAMRADGAVVAIRTYVDVFFFQPGPEGRLVPSRRPVCSIAGVDRTGEAIAFRDDSTLTLTSEASTFGSGTIHTLRCP